MRPMTAKLLAEEVMVFFMSINVSLWSILQSYFSLSLILWQNKLDLIL